MVGVVIVYRFDQDVWYRVHSIVQWDAIKETHCSVFT